MSHGQWVLLVYAILMMLGGLFGFRAGSKVSLYAGLASGLALLVAFGVTFYAIEGGLWAGCVLAGILSLVFGKRLASSGKVMPAGMLMAISLVAAIWLGYSAWAVGPV